MVVKEKHEVPYVDMSDYPGVKKQVLIGPDDGSNEVAIRSFTLEPNGATPYHQHEFPHLVKVESGKGVVINAEGKEYPLQVGSLVYMPDNEVHGFKNTGTEPFVFLCVVPGRGEK